MIVTVLGAGYMGSAMASVAARAGHETRLWGTWLDDELVRAVREGAPHPRLETVLPAGVVTYGHESLAAALGGAELVVFAVSSDGAKEVVGRARDLLPDAPVLSVTKGFLEGARGTMERLDVALSEVAGRPLRYVVASGPAKAVEIARSVLTWMHFASEDLADAEASRAVFGAPPMHVTVGTDVAGALIAAAMKNAYATGLGLWDGLLGQHGHNARAACFVQALVEMERLVVAGGGRPESVWGASGAGDLHVTAAAGRNRAFGARVGEGRPAREVAEEMRRVNQLTEGYPAIATARVWARQRGVTDTPLLDALYEIVWNGADVARTLTALRLSS